MSNESDQAGVEFPLPSLRKFMLPDQVVQVKSFKASSLKELDDQINHWVEETQSIIATPSPISLLDKNYVVAVTYVESASGFEND